MSRVRPPESHEQLLPVDDRVLARFDAILAHLMVLNEKLDTLLQRTDWHLAISPGPEGAAGPNETGRSAPGGSK